MAYTFKDITVSSLLKEKEVARIRKKLQKTEDRLTRIQNHKIYSKALIAFIRTELIVIQYLKKELNNP